ncbi:hypothetical protein WBP07_16650 [Novosphingobium sp. BL-8A]|uniref:hypothetical protein n=1 Tax=Novosphingobium sp. BL-8A TaxID=3127639 RepID=UPI0037570B64
MRKAGFPRACLSLCGGLVSAAAAASPAYDGTSSTGQLVAMALAEAQLARDGSDDAALTTASSAILRGSPLGSGYRLGQVAAGQSESFEQVFLSGRKASVSLAARGGQPVNLRVTDRNRHTVCPSGPACNWVPRFTQRYRIEVRNEGRQQANYYLVVD